MKNGYPVVFSQPEGELDETLVAIAQRLGLL